MDFDFSDDQTQLRDAVRKWVDKAYNFDERRSVVAAGGFSASAYQALAELGLCGLYVQDAYGGMNMGPVEGMVVMEELGRGIVLEPLAQSLIASGVLGAHASAELQAHWLPRVASGEALVVLAYQERAARYQLDACQARATPAASGEPAGWRLDASKSIVPAGDSAHAFLVPAMVAQRMALFLVSRSAAGVSTRGYGTQDGARTPRSHGPGQIPAG